MFSTRVIIVFMACSLWLGVAFAEENVATVVDLRGTVELSSDANGKWLSLSRNQAIQAGSIIRTGDDGWAAIRLQDESLLHLSHNSHFVLKQVAQTAGWLKMGSSATARRSLYQLQLGDAWIRNKNKNIEVDIATPNISAAIRGTELHLQAAADGESTVTVLEGHIVASNSFGNMPVVSGEQVNARQGQAMTKQLVLQPQDAVQWTLAMPPVFQSGAAAVAPGMEGLYQQLANGQVDTALKELETLRVKQPENADVHTLLSLAYLTVDDKDKALSAAQKAVSLAPDSATALMILGYNQQAGFDLQQAEKNYLQVLKQSPDNVPAMVNIARIRFGSDDVEAAVEYLAAAQAVAAEDASVLNLKGFVLLAQQETGQALTAFEQASSAAPRLGEPHMGRGIALMRQGKTEAAMEAITTAILLEPRRALFMSYWAKMLHQLGRHEKALDVLETAQQYDPQDPTPNLYRAIILQDMNQPGEAIAALNQAVVLNDRRGVYRSRFLLDQDLAVKNVDLSRLYAQLGLNQWSRKKAMDSVKQDYTNHSAHDFLAGSMRGDPERSWAHASESLLTRILQPANINSFNSYNNYTSMLEQPGVGGTVVISGGTDGYAGLAAEVFGAIPDYNMAWLVGLIGDKTNGWRGTNGEQATGISGLLNWDVSPKDSLMLSASLFEQYKDDDLFDRYEVDSSVKAEDHWESDGYFLEAGYHHKFAPGRSLLLYLARNETEGVFNTKNTWFPLGEEDAPDLFIHRYWDADYERPYTQFQAQLMWNLGQHDLLVGSMFYDMDNNIDGEVFEELHNQGEVEPLWTLSKGSDQVKQYASFYVGDLWQLSDDWIAEVSVYFEQMDNSDALQETSWTLKEVNPRLGLIWHATDQHTFRMAGFRYLLPMISARLDPTDVAGITLYRNSIEGSLVTEADLAWEYEWETGLFSVNPYYSEREFETHERDPVEDTVAKVLYDGKASGVDVSWNQLLGNDIGLSIDYSYLDLQDEREPVYDRKEHALVMMLKYQHENGFSASLTQTLRDIDSDDSSRPDELIAITDFSLDWELPKKSGSVFLNVNNVFDEKFNWVTDQFVNAGRAPSREVVIGLSASF